MTEERLADLKREIDKYGFTSTATGLELWAAVKSARYVAHASEEVGRNLIKENEDLKNLLVISVAGQTEKCTGCVGDSCGLCSGCLRFILERLSPKSLQIAPDTKSQEVDKK